MTNSSTHTNTHPRVYSKAEPIWQSDVQTTANVEPILLIIIGRILLLLLLLLIVVILAAIR